MIRQLLAAVVFTLALSVAHARSTEMVETGRVLLPQVEGAPSAQRTHSSIVRAVLELGWTIVKDEPGRLEIKYSKGGGKHVAVVALLYDANGFEVKYVDSTNLNYDAAAARIHPTYNMWVNNIVRKVSLAHTSPRN
ncbi:hypothetical protein [Methylibium rhizosphaerae]|uniref:hypothetical protein n=1 Tax=Methylibium rhizosphaerae TaxID=2570323 RepID=UPI00112D6323|nr:hypothetical protein [Methylibium rhizosphaerae]